MTEQIAQWFANLSQGSRLFDYLITFIVSCLPILECRGGMIVAGLRHVPAWQAFIICYIGNILPIPFILLFIKQIFAFMKKHNILKGFIEKLEGKTAKNQEKVLKYKQWGLLAFVAIPLPGTGGWTGSLFAALLNIDFKKAFPIIALGILIAEIIMFILVYGVGGAFAQYFLGSQGASEAAQTVSAFISQSASCAACF